MKGNKAVLIGSVITGLMAIFFLFNAGMKIMWRTAYPAMGEQMAKIGLPMDILPKVAALEAMCAIVYLIPRTSVLGAVLFTGYLGGAMLTHLRVGENIFMHVCFGIVIWLGIYLREPRLHALLPIRKR